MGLFTWFQNIPNRMTPAPFRLLQIGSAFWQSKALYTATKLDIASVLGDESLGVTEIASRASSQTDGTYRLLRLLVAMGVFEEISPRVFQNNKVSNFLRKDNPMNVRPMILMHNSEQMNRPRGEMMDEGILNGRVPFEAAHGKDLFGYMDSDPEFSSLFSNAMDCVESFSGDSFVTDFDWARFYRVIDIGGSKGSKSASILRSNPQMEAIVVDREEVINKAQQQNEDLYESNISSRLTFEAGDLFGSIPEARNDKDIYLLSAVLHAFNDADCIKGLTNVANTIGETGARIAVMELIMPESNADLVSASFDMQMFMGTNGKERNMDEWKALISQSGLVLEEIVGLRNIGKILVLRRPDS
jgi:hypothetical protein